MLQYSTAIQYTSSTVATSTQQTSHHYIDIISVRVIGYCIVECVCQTSHKCMGGGSGIPYGLWRERDERGERVQFCRDAPAIKRRGCQFPCCVGRSAAGDSGNTHQQCTLWCH